MYTNACYYDLQLSEQFLSLKELNLITNLEQILILKYKKSKLPKRMHILPL